MCIKKLKNTRNGATQEGGRIEEAWKPRVGIIGAGVSGLVTIKSLLEEGCASEIVCYERSDNIGGLWFYREASQSHPKLVTVSHSTVANSSKELSAFSDWPPPANLPNYLPHRLMYKYLESYAKRFDCLKHVHLNHEVKEITKHEKTGTWRMKVTSTRAGPESGGGDGAEADSKETIEFFDVLVICTGHHSVPFMPQIPGQQTFKGNVIHSSDFKRPNKEYAGKNVLVVGVGNSGLDIAVDLSGVANQVFLSTRRGCWVLPRVGLRGGRPYDFSMLRRSMHSLKSLVPINLMQVVIETMLNKKFDHELYGLRPEHPLFSEHPTVNDAIAPKIMSGQIKIKGKVERLAPGGAIFEEDLTEATPIDHIVCATGYQLNFPFLDPAIHDQIVDPDHNTVHLYKDMIHPEDDSLYFIGLPNALGPLFPIAEMQSRYVAQILAGKCPLPSVNEMERDIDQYRQMRRSLFTDTARHGTQVEWIPYLDEIADLIGVKPTFIELLRHDPRLAMACYFGPCVPYQYRLSGPHPWDGAREAILSVKERVDAPLRSARPWIKRTRPNLASNNGLQTVNKSFTDYGVLFRLFCGLFVVFFFEIYMTFA